MNKRGNKVGLIEEALPNLEFRVRMEDGELVRCYVGGKMKHTGIRLILQDKVEVVHTPDMGEIGRIVWRK